MSRPTILLNPGPVSLSERVRAALTEGDWCHREPEFAQLTQANNVALARVYPEMAADFDTVTLTGSGTSAVEAMLTGFAPHAGGTLVLANGVYGERMARMLAAQRKPFSLLQRGWLEALDLAAVKAELDQRPEITHLACVHHETTTGRLNDLAALGTLCRERGLRLLLDAVSSFGAERIEADAWNLDASAATANKCLHGVAGLSFVLARKDLWRAEAEGSASSVYLDLRAYHAQQHGAGFSPFTQAVQVAFALREALAEHRDEGGWPARRRSYRARAERIHASLVDCGVSTLLEPADYSSVLWSYRLPTGLSYETLHDRLKAEDFVIYAGQGDLSRQVFRIAHMGQIGEADLDRLCEALPRCLSARGG